MAAPAASLMQKKYFLEQLGCAKNQVDGETILFALNENGFLQCDDPVCADFIIVNSCGFIESAKQESINTVLEYKKNFPDKKIILAGCLAKRYAQDLQTALPEADLLFCDEDIFKIAASAVRLCSNASTSTAGGSGTDRNESEALREGCGTRGASPRMNIGKRPLLSFTGSAYIKISEGCNNCCTFCAIPLIRGRIKSRSVSDIKTEARYLLRRGIKELCLVAQDAAAYGADLVEGGTLNKLLKELSQLEGDFWVRLLYLHPDHFPLDILETINSDKRFVPYFDIPFQHISEPLLCAMNRRGNREKYLQLVSAIRNNVDNAVIRSTFLTGFPGESEDDFASLLRFQADAALDWVGVFTYSKEDGTPAFNFKNKVPKKTAKKRKDMLLEKQIKITRKRLDRFVGLKTKCLLEEEITGSGENGCEDGSIFLGRLFCHAPEVDGAAVLECEKNTGAVQNGIRFKCGDFVDVEVSAVAGFDLQVRAI